MEPDDPDVRELENAEWRERSIGKPSGSRSARTPTMARSGRWYEVYP